MFSLAHQAFALRLGQGAAARGGQQTGDHGLVRAVSVPLAVAQGDQEGPFGEVGQLGFHVSLAAAQEQRTDAAAQFVEVAVAAWTAALIELIKLTVEPEQRAETRTGRES